MLKKLKLPISKRAKVLNEEDVLNAIELSNGTQISVAKILNVDYHIAKNNVRYYNSTIIAIEKIRNKIADIAEYALVKAINEGDNNLIRFALERLMPTVYGNKTLSIEGDGNNIQINIKLPDDSNESETQLIKKIGKIGN